jgi:hypothetical protein
MTETVEVLVSLRYRANVPLGVGEEDHVLTTRAEIWGDPLWKDDEEKIREEFKLGELKFYLIRLGQALNEGVPLEAVFDTFQETSDMGGAIFGSSYDEFHPLVRERFEDAFPHDDILQLHLLAIEPFARGQRLGLAVLERTMRDWSNGCSLVVIKPHPLQFNTKGKIAQDVPESHRHHCTSKREAAKRLRRYYEQLGFARVGKSDFCALCPKVQQPTAEDLKLPDTIHLPISTVEECLQRKI